MPRLVNMEDTNMLDKESDELHSYARTNIQILVAWFTFFVTVNYAVIGWAAIRRANERPLVPFSNLCWVFILQNVLAIVTCGLMAGYFSKTGKRIEHILTMSSEDAKSAFPKFIYSATSCMMAAACTLLLVLWVHVLRLPR